ncbi:hypothetical protein P9112_007510 [Eukaryota sp. TZLM1-RC]
MQIVVHLTNTSIDAFEVGEGQQSLEWLCYAALADKDFNNLAEIPLPKSVRDYSGNALPLDDAIRDHLNDGDHIWINAEDYI